MATDLELQLYSARAVNFATNATSPTKSPRSPAKSPLTSHNGAARSGIQQMPKPPHLAQWQGLMMCRGTKCGKCWEGKCRRPPLLHLTRPRIIPGPCPLRII